VTAQQQPDSSYPANWFPGAARSQRHQAERRKVATIRELAALPQDQLERALQFARDERSEGQGA
jgi:hypothetical protein